MGKRKSSKKPMGPKKKDPLPSSFTCLFCNHEKSVSVKLDKKLGVGNLECKVCGQRFQCAINYLSAAVDVYGEWVDAAETVAEDSILDGRDAGAGSGRTKPTSSSKYADDEEDDRTRYSGPGIVEDDDDYD